MSSTRKPFSKPVPAKKYFDNRYYKNPYAGTYKDKWKQNKSNQYPERMHKTHKYPKSNLPTEDTFDKELMKAQVENGARDHLKGIELVTRTRYGNEDDILRHVFTKTKEEIESEKFKLILVSRKLLQRIMWSLQKVPKHEKYVLGAEMRTSGYTILKHAVSIKRRYYRKNLLEFIDVECDILREMYYIAHNQYPEWINHESYQWILDDIDIVGKLIGGLIKSTVV